MTEINSIKKFLDMYFNDIKFKLNNESMSFLNNLFDDIDLFLCSESDNSNNNFDKYFIDIINYVFDDQKFQKIDMGILLNTIPNSLKNSKSLLKSININYISNIIEDYILVKEISENKFQSYLFLNILQFSIKYKFIENLITCHYMNNFITPNNTILINLGTVINSLITNKLNNEKDSVNIETPIDDKLISKVLYTKYKKNFDRLIKYNTYISDILIQDENITINDISEILYDKNINMVFNKKSLFTDKNLISIFTVNTLLFLFNKEEVYIILNISKKTNRIKSTSSKNCKFGVKKNGDCKEKPDKKESSVSIVKSKKSNSKNCKFGVKKDGDCKQKPGKKQSPLSNVKTKKSNSSKNCKFGVKKDGSCKEKPGKKQSPLSNVKTKKSNSSKNCKFGVKKNGDCKEKPGKKQSPILTVTKSKKSNSKNCKFGVKKDGDCKQKPGKKQSNLSTVKTKKSNSSKNSNMKVKSKKGKKLNTLDRLIKSIDKHNKKNKKSRE